jgi:hypothetical protein
MATVVLTLVFIPFGKFFHVIQRPGQRRRRDLQAGGPGAPRRLRLPALRRAAGGQAVHPDLKATMEELKLGFSQWAETCPRCKRVLRGQAYLDAVKRGFR